MPKKKKVATSNVIAKKKKKRSKIEGQCYWQRCCQKEKKKKRQHYCRERERERERESNLKKTVAFLSIKKKFIPNQFSLNFGGENILADPGR